MVGAFADWFAVTALFRTAGGVATGTGGGVCTIVAKLFGGSGAGPSLLANARAEGARTKPTFRQAFAARRCVVPADGFLSHPHLGADVVTPKWG